jgi:hypothetical protein
MTAPIDSIPRVSVRDLFIALRQFETDDRVTLENLRLRFCYDRNARRKGDYMFATAVIVAGEMQKLGLIETGSLPKATSKTHESSKAKTVQISPHGRELLDIFKNDRSAAFDRLFGLMYTAHRNLQALVGVICKKNLFAPLATSVKDHIGAAYGSASALAAAVAGGELNIEDTLRLLAQRMGRPLSDEERAEINAGMAKLVQDSKISAENEDGTEFAKNFLAKVNDVVIPAVFRADGLAFDYRTHRTIWSLGEEFKLWGSTTSHPDYSGTVVYRTAKIVLSDNSEQVKELVFDSGLAKTKENFLAKLYEAYQKLQTARKSKIVNAWELRAVFCLDNRCQQSVFNSLFEENYAGDSMYNLHFEIQQAKSRHEVPLRAGKRSVGTILMTRE